MRKPRAFLFATILLVGDSHTVASFGRKLDAQLRTLPDARVASYASCGSSPVAWFTGWTTPCGYRERGLDGEVILAKSAPTPIYSKLLADLRPDVTIIALGANLFKASLAHSARTVRQMAEMTAQAGSRCLWVGPPHSRERYGPKMDELYGVLRGASHPQCEFADSRDWTHYPDQGGDGTHYDQLGPEGVRISEAWAGKVFEATKRLMGLSRVRRGLVEGGLGHDFGRELEP